MEIVGADQNERLICNEKKTKAAQMKFFSSLSTADSVIMKDHTVWCEAQRICSRIYGKVDACECSYAFRHPMEEMGCQ